MKILNLVIDEKFFDDVIECQDMIKGADHSYFFLTSVSENTCNFKFKYIKNVERIEFLDKNKLILFLGQSDYNAVFLHSLAVIPTNLIKKIPSHIKVCWFSWGFDIYNIPEYKPFVKIPLYDHETEKVLKTFSLTTYVRKLSPYNILKNCWRVHQMYSDVVPRIDFFSGILPYEYDMMKVVSGFCAEQIQYMYTKKSILEGNQSYARPKGKNILVGNSAFPTNNHLDIIQHLKKIPVGEKYIYMPLSYGNSGDYKEKVKERFTKAYGSFFVPLEGFVPFDEYKNIIDSCSVAIFFHLRQQAVNNIRMALMNGCKVFMNENNKAFLYYKKLGLYIYSLQKDLVSAEDLLPLNDIQIEKNREIMNEYNSFDYYKNIMTDIYSKIQKE